MEDNYIFADTYTAESIPKIQQTLDYILIGTYFFLFVVLVCFCSLISVKKNKKKLKNLKSNGFFPFPTSHSTLGAVDNSSRMNPALGFQNSGMPNDPVYGSIGMNSARNTSDLTRQFVPQPDNPMLVEAMNRNTFHGNEPNPLVHSNTGGPGPSDRRGSLQGGNQPQGNFYMREGTSGAGFFPQNN